MRPLPIMVLKLKCSSLSSDSSGCGWIRIDPDIESWGPGRSTDEELDPSGNKAWELESSGKPETARHIINTPAARIPTADL